MDVRIQLSRQTVKAMQRRLQEAYRQDDVRLVRRIQALLDHLVNEVPVPVLSTQWGFSPVLATPLIRRRFWPPPA
jgi:hypothetical protein